MANIFEYLCTHFCILIVMANAAVGISSSKNLKLHTSGCPYGANYSFWLNNIYAYDYNTLQYSSLEIVWLLIWNIFFSKLILVLFKHLCIRLRKSKNPIRVNRNTISFVFRAKINWHYYTVNIKSLLPTKCLEHLPPIYYVRTRNRTGINY